MVFQIGAVQRASESRCFHSLTGKNTCTTEPVKALAAAVGTTLNDGAHNIEKARIAFQQNDDSTQMLAKYPVIADGPLNKRLKRCAVSDNLCVDRSGPGMDVRQQRSKTCLGFHAILVVNRIAR